MRIPRLEEKRKFTLERAEGRTEKERERERSDRRCYYGTLESQPGD